MLNIDDFTLGKNIHTSNSKTGNLEASNVKYEEPVDEGQEQEFEFRLFSGPTIPKASITSGGQFDVSNQDGKRLTSNNRKETQKLRIRLHSPTPEPAKRGEGKFIQSFRGWQYYFTTPELHSTSNVRPNTPNTLRKEYEDVAISGPRLIQLARKDIWVSHLNRCAQGTQFVLSQTTAYYLKYHWHPLFQLLIATCL